MKFASLGLQTLSADAPLIDGARESMSFFWLLS